MSELRITLENGATLSLVQAAALKRLLDEHPGWIWHPNYCGCCVSVHPAQPEDGDDHVHEGYVINSDGDVDWVTV